MVEKSEEKDKELKRVIRFRELFFISFGGQGPLISLLTFGTVMIFYAGLLSTFAMIGATIVVLMNGLVIYFLSKRFTRSGGYYTYAFHGLTEKLGLSTGWNYIIYAFAYGGTLLAGSAYIIYLMTGFSPFYISVIIVILASIIFMSGVKISSKYAIGSGIVEMIGIVLLSVFFLYLSNFHFYLPIFSEKDITTKFIEGILFGLGIPTGYGSITPLSGEVKYAQKTVGEVAISVILVGGLLSSFFFYALASLNFTGNLVQFLLSTLNLPERIGILVVAINDGMLGGMAYMLASSRVIYAMSKDELLPKFFSKVNKERPIYSEALSTVFFIIGLTLSSYLLGLYGTFQALGALAGLFNIFIHMSANFSLFRISLKRFIKRVGEIVVSILAILISAYIFLYSLPSVEKYVAYIFFGWIILGFLYAESLDILRQTPREEQK
ncbi:amino acid permease [Sulfolobus sp. A20]|uniref:APC family permease n=2 Tax=Sulfolobaceae TaxID=118883 RepID=UPI000845F779|nr:APC family permease [Sulfolobus sp. A20]TRM76852.1 APC family permease [Sulfolobus sp. E5]TRM77260.1 APC family permease [Sulfolobus sp. A20-N-F8]TRM84889.1 APC family permease [Sulfolobus sp. F3]TRM99294.1 APC family permease [Sulfolobus sp. F1]TRN04752.1 APC family permease [Sulfolobus sp. E1]